MILAGVLIHENRYILCCIFLVWQPLIQSVTNCFINRSPAQELRREKQMYLLMGMIPLLVGILLLICAGRKSRFIHRTAIVMVVVGILLIVVSLSMFFLVLSGRVTLPLK